MHVKSSQLNHVASLPGLMLKATIIPVGPNAKHPLIKLQSLDGTGSLDTFLTKFQHLASYLCWDDEDMFNHLCASLKGAAGQVFWDVGPCVTMADILQTRLGTQLQAEHFIAEL